MKRIVMLSACGLWLAAPAFAAGTQVPQLSLTLEQAVSRALASSHRLQAKKLDVAAAQARVDTQAALLWPRLSLEASYRYLGTIANIPAGMLSPRQPEIPFGDHHNYSVGPMVSWNFWDTGGAWFNLRAAQAQLRARQEDLRAAERQLTLQTRLAYFQVQMNLAQVRLITDALKLSQAQYGDIRAQQRAGQANRIDLLSSHQDTLANSRSLRQARTDLAGSLRDLMNVMGYAGDEDLSFPVEASQKREDGEHPTLLLTLDPLEQSLAGLEPAAKSELDAGLPQLRVLLEMAEASRQMAAAIATGHWPKFQGSAKISRDYPNGPIQEAYTQQTYSLGASWSLWEWGRIVHQAEEQQLNAQSGERQREQMLADLTLSWRKSQDQLNQLRDIQAINLEAARETETIGRLIYEAYRAGRSSFIEVQNANYRALGAKIQIVRTQVQTLIQLATLESLARPAAAGPAATDNGKGR